MKISTERLKEIIKEELEAHALLEQPGNPDSPPGNPDDKPDEYDAPEHVISGSELPKSWKQQQQMAKKGRVFVRKNQGWWHLTYLVRLAAPAYKKDLKPNSRKSRRLVATMVKKMQNGKSTLRTRQDYGRVVNYLDLHFGRKNMAEPKAIQGYWKHLPDKEAAIKNRAKYVAAGIVPSAMPSDDVLNNKVVVVVARNSAYGLTLQQAQALRKYILNRTKKPGDRRGEEKGEKRGRKGLEGTSTSAPEKKARFGSEEEKQRYIVARRLFPKVRPNELMRLVKKSFGLPQSVLGHEAALKAARGN